MAVSPASAACTVASDQLVVRAAVSAFLGRYRGTTLSSYELIVDGSVSGWARAAGWCSMAHVTASDAWKLDRVGSAKAGINPALLAKMPQSFAVIGDTQFLPGYCVLLVDDPGIDRLTDLPKTQRLDFLNSMDTLGQAVATACRATDNGFRRMNYEILGNTDAYLHAHLFPRYEWEHSTHIGGPVRLYDPEEFSGPEAALAPRQANSVGVSSPNSPASGLKSKNALIWRRHRSPAAGEVPPASA